jgi:hypothetical protein
MPCIARRYLRLRNASYFYKALNFCYFLFKQKVREYIVNETVKVIKWGSILLLAPQNKN